jgi:hypothetical protein
MAFSCAPTDESFVDTAPHRFAETFAIAKPAEQVWADLTGDDALHWCKALTKLRWTSERPYGVGTTRTVRVLGLIRLDERFIVWEEGRRKTFVGVQANLPIIKRVAEDYLVEPAGEGSCTFTWKIGIEPSGSGKPGMPLNKAIFRSLFRDTRQHYASG